MGKAKEPDSTDIGLVWEGGEAQVEALFRSSWPRLTRIVARRMINQADTEDAVQDAFLGLWKKLLSGMLQPDAAGYLLVSAFNAARNRNERRRMPDLAGKHGVPFELPDLKQPSAEDQYFWRDGYRSLENVLQGLSPVVRTAFVLHRIDGMSIPEVAQALGKSQRTIARYVATALDHCQERLSAYRP